MTAPTSVSVDLGDRSYDVVVGPGLLADAARHLAPLIVSQPVVVVSDDNVAALHLETLTRALDGAGIDHREIVLDAGEPTKDIATLERLIEGILDTRPERGSTVIALGGGVVGDITGVAASLVLRGIDFIQIPTTLLSQVDSSVGGKTGVNTRHGKNLVGSFYQPRLVLADTGVLDTLSRRELLAGYAEVVKYGLLGDRTFFDWLVDNGQRVVEGDAEARRHAVVTSCRMKADIVAGDERETGRRALLNLGHTFGHALEAECGYGDTLLHGEAVAIGTMLAFDLSVTLGLCPSEDASRVRRHFADMGLPTGFDAIGGRDWSAATLIDHMGHDKKVRAGRIKFILVRGIGQAFVADEVALEDVRRHLELAIAAK
jgi:3-dehydroquinate synthase